MQLARIRSELRLGSSAQGLAVSVDDKKLLEILSAGRAPKELPLRGEPDFEPNYFAYAQGENAQYKIKIEVDFSTTTTPTPARGLLGKIRRTLGELFNSDLILIELRRGIVGRSQTVRTKQFRGSSAYISFSKLRAGRYFVAIGNDEFVSVGPVHLLMPNERLVNRLRLTIGPGNVTRLKRSDL